MKILKFGGKSLANGIGLQNVIDIISNKVKKSEKIAVVVSARDNTTNILEELLEKSKQGYDISKEWEEFKNYQINGQLDIDYSNEFTLLEHLFQGVKLVEDYSSKIKDLVLAHGELLAIKLISKLLVDKGVNAIAIDSRKIFITDSNFGFARIIDDLSQDATTSIFKNLAANSVPIVSGFIAQSENGETTTLGRNGSNYSASLLAKYLQAEEVESYTHIDGIFTANPDLVPEAKIIRNLNFQEAGELAEFGASVLHTKTILPLIEKNIPLRILNIFHPYEPGTLISTENKQKGVKTITVQNNVSIISIVGKGFLGKKGIDGRIFKNLSDYNINVGVVSQGSSETGVDFLISKKDADLAVKILKKEFALDFYEKDVSSITARKDVSVITIIGQDIDGFTSSFKALSQNNIHILLINNTMNGRNISLVLENKDIPKAVNVIHEHIFGIAKKINIAVFGKGTVGSSFINQVLKAKHKILIKQGINLNIFGVANSKKLLLNSNGIDTNWEEEFSDKTNTHKANNKIIESKDAIKDIIEFSKTNNMVNLVAIDNTANDQIINKYEELICNGFNLISSNKKSNTSSYNSYKQLRQTLKKYNKKYLYETNVGAGLPLIDTIKLLHSSGENITRIRGVFSGSLSYLFNRFSSENQKFDSILVDAIKLGFTEPDAREDLCGNDVARKLLILARELDLKNELKEVKVHNLIPESLREIPLDDFLNNMSEMNDIYNKLKDNQKPNHVLRYIGDLSGDLQEEKGDLSVKLISVPKNSSLGQLKNSDSIFEIYTQSYGENPIVIQGAGAGAEVTARGVFGDLLRIADM